MKTNLEAARSPDEQPRLRILNEYMEGEQESEDFKNEVNFCNRLLTFLEYVRRKMKNVGWLRMDLRTRKQRRLCWRQLTDSNKK